ncbi:MAG: RHS repeat-associated core domain-containing protein [Holophagales bacterium]|nr:RHS repeat-associated core domain-containing protein [Holophagales bacterium]
MTMNLSTTETFEYDPTTGFRTAHQIVSSDVVSGITKTRTLRRVIEKGVDASGRCLATGSLSTACSNLGFAKTVTETLTGALDATPLTSTYKRWFYYGYGTLKAARDTTGFYAVDRDIAPVGKVIGERGTDGRLSYADVSPQLTTTTTYDLLGRVVVVQPPGEGPETVSFGRQNVVRLKFDTTNTEMSRQESFFDELARPTAERKLMPDGGWSCRVSVWDAAGHAVGQTAWWRNGDPGVGNLCDDPLNVQFTISGGPGAVSTPRGSSILGFDALDRATLSRLADGSEETNTYWGWWTQESTRTLVPENPPTDAITTTTVIERDFMGRIVALTEPAATKADRASAMNPAETTTYRYDHVGRLVVIRKPGSDSNATPGSSITQVRTRLYDDFGWLVSSTDPELPSTSFTVYARDARGNPLRTNEGGVSISRVYDVAGRHRSSAWASEPSSWLYNGNPTTAYEIFEYDARYGYDLGRSNGKLIFAIRANHLLTNEGTVDLGWYGFTDFLHYGGPGGRISFRQHGDNWLGFSSTTVPPNAIQALDSATKRKTPTQIAFERYFESQGRKVEDGMDTVRQMVASESAAATRLLSDPWNPSGMARWQYRYDGAGRLSQIVYPRRDEGFPTEVTYGYNRGFLTGITAAIRNPLARTTVENVTGTLSYNADGSVASTVISSNGGAARVFSLATPRDESGMSRLQTWDLRGPVATNPAVETRNYAFDPVGNIVSISSGLATDLFVYDSRGRLIRDVISARAGQNDTQDRDYDGFGNLTRVTNTGDPVDRPVSRSTNRLASAGMISNSRGDLIFDTFAGRNVARDYYPDGLTKAENVHPPGAYSGNPPAISAWAPDFRGATSLTFYGDGLYCNTEVFLGHLRDESGQMLTDYKADPTQTCDCTSYDCEWADRFRKDYIRIGPWAMVTYDRTDSQGTAFWALDHLGSTRTRFSRTGQVLFHSRLDSFGNEISGSGGERYRFAGHERQHVTGIDGAQFPVSDNMGARTYVPMLGRFTRPDPANSFSLFNPQSLNRYAYGLNNPVKYIDPDGKTALVAAGVGARIVQISKSALLGAAVGAGVRVILNGLIRFDHPNYSIWTGVTGSAVTGAITGGVSAQTTLAKFGANVVGVAAGALVNGIKAGQLADQLTVSAVSGVAAGALTGVGDVALSAGAEKMAGSLPAAMGTMEGLEKFLGVAVSGTGSLFQEVLVEGMGALGLIADTPPPNSVACDGQEVDCGANRKISGGGK